ncbi:MAG: pentapeptide repeat-containing protein [Arcobacteraceae bacterium]
MIKEFILNYGEIIIVGVFFLFFFITLKKINTFKEPVIDVINKVFVLLSVKDEVKEKILKFYKKIIILFFVILLPFGTTILLYQTFLFFEQNEILLQQLAKQEEFNQKVNQINEQQIINDLRKDVIFHGDKLQEIISIYYNEEQKTFGTWYYTIQERYYKAFTTACNYLIKYVKDNSNEMENSLYLISSFRPNPYIRITNLNRQYIDLSGVNLKDTRLDSLSFNNASMDFSDFNDSKIMNSEFKNTSLIKANFSNAKISSVNFENANLFDANFSNAKITSTINPTTKQIYPSSFKGAQLLNTNFDNVDLSGVIWTDGKECPKGSIGKCIK